MRISLLLFSLLFVLAGVAHAYSQPKPGNMTTVGEATLKVFWFEIYDARLDSLTGQYSQADQPMSLELTYKRDISRKDLLDETAKQWRRQGLSADQFTPWLALLTDIWPDIRKQDSLMFYQDDQSNGHFYLNDRFIGSVNEPGFSQAFLAIWLSENSAFPELSRSLRGE
jgi:hypothetical protein